MSENTNQNEGSVDLAKLQERIAELEATNGRLLNESKDNKTKASEYKSKLDVFEKESVEKSGDLQKQLDYEKNRNKQLEEDNKIKSNKVLDQNIRATLSKVASDAISVEDIIALKRDELKNGIDKDSLILSEDFAKSTIDSLRKERPHWFKTVSTESVDATKANGKQVGTLDVNSASIDDLKTALRNQIINKE